MQCFMRYSPKIFLMFNCVSFKSIVLKSLAMKAMKSLIKSIMDGKYKLSFTRTNMQTAFTATKQKACRI